MHFRYCIFLFLLSRVFAASGAPADSPDNALSATADSTISGQDSIIGDLSPAKTDSIQSIQTVEQPDTTEPGTDSTSIAHDSVSSPSDTSLREVQVDSLEKTIETIPDTIGEKSAWEGIDTSYKFYFSPYWAFGAGWTLGSFSAFDMWEKGLPRNLADFGLESEIPRAQFVPSAHDTDTTNISYEIQESPSNYHIYFPLMFSVATLTDTTSRLRFESSFFFIRKSLISSLQDDSLSNRIDIKHSLTYLSLSLGAQYSFVIPEQYFRVNETEQTTFNAAFAVAPLTYIQTGTSAKAEGLPDGLFSHLKSRAVTPFSSFDAFGLGLSWKIGISSLRSFTPSTGMNIGIYYLGHWSGMFYGDDSRLKRGDIYAATSKPGDNFSMIAHRFEISVMFLRGKKPPAQDK
ncbi:MAG: hypothetical protein GF401_05765 [Chitinivibrionales bacterium]|nr:hypothetical protein [Chitinivibrionales bacterium]